jgi:hypothetical protein
MTVRNKDREKGKERGNAAAPTVDQKKGALSMTMGEEFSPQLTLHKLLPKLL